MFRQDFRRRNQMVLPMEKMQLDRKDPRTELRGGPHLKSSRRETTKERGLAREVGGKGGQCYPSAKENKRQERNGFREDAKRALMW